MFTAVIILTMVYFFLNVCLFGIWIELTTIYKSPRSFLRKKITCIVILLFGVILILLIKILPMRVLDRCNWFFKPQRP